MTTKLTIRWDGEAPGLGTHALSLAAWHDALGKLLAAVRRTASGMVKEALDDPEYGAKGGRLAKRAGEIDLQLVAVRDGCVNIDFQCTIPPQPGQQDLFLEELPERALDRVLDDIEHEARGEPRSAPVRKFLQAFPSGVTVQDYTLEVNGQVRKRVTVGETRLAAAPAQLVGLRRLIGFIIAVGFEPGSPSITVKTPAGQVRCQASEAQVELALGLRSREIVAMVVMADPARLVWLADKESPPVIPDGKARTETFSSRWAHTLDLLSR
jgi:hypothetical protein